MRTLRPDAVMKSYEGIVSRFRRSYLAKDADALKGKAKAASAVQRLAGMDALMMDAVAAMADVADELEKAAELDETYERSFVMVIEATAAMLQGLEKAKAATQALAMTGPTAART